MTIYGFLYLAWALLRFTWWGPLTIVAAILAIASYFFLKVKLKTELPAVKSFCIWMLIEIVGAVILGTLYGNQVRM